MKNFFLYPIRLAIISLFTVFFIMQTSGSDILQNPYQWHYVMKERTLCEQKVNMKKHAMVMTYYISQEPEDSLSKEEIRALRKEERAERRKQARAERQENSINIDNPNNADYILIGDDLPRGNSVLDAIRGRIPGMTISSDGNVIVNGPTTYRANSTVLYLVDGTEVSRDYINSMPVEDIERIEIFTGPSIAMFGSRAGVAVISIYSKHAARNTLPAE